jgi:hypothetical protein
MNLSEPTSLGRRCVQHTRLDSRQVENSTMTTIAYPI